MGAVLGHCGSNLCEGGRDRRLRASVLLFAASLTAGVVMVKVGLGPGWRMALFLPFLLSGQGLFAALYGT